MSRPSSRQFATWPSVGATARGSARAPSVVFDAAVLGFYRNELHPLLRVPPGGVRLIPGDGLSQTLFQRGRRFPTQTCLRLLGRRDVSCDLARPLTDMLARAAGTTDHVEQHVG